MLLPFGPFNFNSRAGKERNESDLLFVVVSSGPCGRNFRGPGLVHVAFSTDSDACGGQTPSMVYGYGSLATSSHHGKHNLGT